MPSFCAKRQLVISDPRKPDLDIHTHLQNTRGLFKQEIKKTTEIFVMMGETTRAVVL